MPSWRARNSAALRSMAFMSFSELFGFRTILGVDLEGCQWRSSLSVQTPLGQIQVQSRWRTRVAFGSVVRPWDRTSTLVNTGLPGVSSDAQAPTPILHGRVQGPSRARSALRPEKPG